MAKKLISLDMSGTSGKAKRAGTKLYRIHLTLEVGGVEVKTARDWTALDEKEAWSKVKSAITAFKGVVIKAANAEVIS